MNGRLQFLDVLGGTFELFGEVEVWVGTILQCSGD